MCEALLPDAVEGVLSEAEQRAFDSHVAACTPCARELAEAQRGAAWLAMLKSEAPQPPEGMLDRILAETTRSTATVAPLRPAASALAAPPLRSIGGLWPVAARTAAPARGWRPLRQKFAGMFRIDSAHAGLQPRLAMTAAMAFFSIALTLSLTGMRLRDVRAERFTPNGLRRTAVDASAAAIRSFQNMRMVYQVESRVSELRSDEALNGGHEGVHDDADRDQASGDSASSDRDPLSGHGSRGTSR